MGLKCLRPVLTVEQKQKQNSSSVFVFVFRRSVPAQNGQKQNCSFVTDPEATFLPSSFVANKKHNKTRSNDDATAAAAAASLLLAR